ncbi:hypothetical protein ABTM07_19335, partial [Acinetobacter baumannii]
TKELAQASTLVVVPTGADLGDLQPTVDLMHQLANAGVDLERMLAVVVKASSAGMAREAHGYLTAAGYQVLEHATPFANTYVQAFSVGKAMTEAEAA